MIGELAQGKRVSFTLNKKFVTRSGSTVRVRKFSARVPSAEDDAEEVIAQIMIDITADTTTGSHRNGPV